MKTWKELFPGEKGGSSNRRVARRMGGRKYYWRSWSPPYRFLTELSYEVSSVVPLRSPLLAALCKRFDAYGTLSGCLEDGTMANKHVLTCATKTFPPPRKKCEQYFRTVRIAWEKKCAFFIFSLSLRMEKLFNRIKYKTIKYKAYKLEFVQKIWKSGYIVPKVKNISATVSCISCASFRLTCIYIGTMNAHVFKEGDKRDS